MTTRPGDRMTTSFSALLAAEVLRVRSRRLARWLGIGMLVALTVTIVVVWANPPMSFVDDPNWDLGPLAQVFRLDTDLALSFVYGFVPSLVGVGLLLGSSLIGAEWGTRGLTNLLVWEPRRDRVLLAKLAAIGIVVGAFVLAFLTVLVALLALAASARGEIAGFELGRVALAIARAAISVVALAALGATTAAVMRSTVAAFVIAFVLIAVVQPLLLGWSQGLGRWLFTTNAISFLTWEPVPFSDFAQATPGKAGLVLAGYAVVFVGASATVFRRQEIG